MARIRTIKPEFFTSEDIVGLSPLARLLYIAIWCEADREGRLTWKPKTLKMRYLPADDCDIDALCAEVVAAGLVRLYGNGYAVIPRFTAHQHVNPRESASALPDPKAITSPASRVADASTTREAPDAHAPVTHREEGKGRKGKEGEHASTTRTGGRRRASETSLPPDFSVSESVKAWASVKGYDRLGEHLESFKAKCTAKGYKYVDWDAAFENAIRDDWARLRSSPSAHGSARHHLPAEDTFI